MRTARIDIIRSLFLTVVGVEFTIIVNEKILFVSSSNGKISLQREMQRQGSLTLEDIYHNLISINTY